MQMRTMEHPRSIRAVPALDDTVGAGNFLDHVLDAAADPHAAALYFSKPLRLPDGSETSSLSLAQLDDLATRLASAYQSVGLRSKEPVALFLEESVAYFIHYLALNRIGAIPTFVNSEMAPDIATQFAARVRATLIVADEPRLSACRSRPELLGDVRVLDVSDLDLDRRQLVAQRYIHQPEDPVLLAHTSGTTGIPKAVQFNHYGFFYGVRKQLNKPMGGRALCALPASHASCVSILMSMLLRNAPVLLQTDRDPEAMARAIETFRPELFAAFSKYFIDLCRVDLETYDLSSVAWWLSTGDASHEPHIRRLVNQGSHVIGGERVKGSMFIDNFGSSEFGFAVFRNIHSPKTNNYGRCIGKAFDWVDVALLDERGLPVPQGEVGLLGVRAPCVTAGYWNDSNMTQRMRHGGYWLTGDYAYLGDDGAYYHVDRTPDRIMVSGTAIYSTEIEERLLSRMPEIFDCTVVAARKDGKEALTLFFEPRMSDADFQSIVSHANDWMAAFGYPIFDEAHLQSAHEFVGVTGKKLKRVLRENDH